MLHVKAANVHELIVSLNHYCFYAGADKFNSRRGLASLPENFLERASRSDVLEYFHCLNWSVKQAQSIIIENRLKLEREHRAQTLEVDAPYNFDFLINLVTDYADTIGWWLLEHDISWVRSQFLDVQSHSDLDEHNWDSVQTVIEHLNRDPNQVALATDLTSFMHVGDVFMRNIATGVTSHLEIKSGIENERIREVVSAGSPGEFEIRMSDYMASAAKPDHSFRQLERTLRQSRRMARSSGYIQSGGTERFDLKSDTPVIVQESEGPEQSWSELARDLANGLAPEEAKLVVVDECLFFEYGRSKHTVVREKFFQYRIGKHLGLGNEEANYSRLRVFDVARHAGLLPAFRPVTTCLMALGEEAQSRLLALDDYLIVHLNIPALGRFLWARGVSLAVRNMRAREQEYSDRLVRDLVGQNRIPVVTLNTDRGPVEFSLLGGLLGRILFNFLRPSTIVTMHGPASNVVKQTVERLAGKSDAEST
jgi:hypothetical protein